MNESKRYKQHLASIQRQKLIFDRLASGETYEALAAELRISKASVRALELAYTYYVRRAAQEQIDWAGAPWSTNTTNALRRLGINNIDQLKQRITSGIMRRNKMWYITEHRTLSLGDEAWVGEILPFLDAIGFDWRSHYKGQKI